MFKPNETIKSLKHQDINCKESFTILSWNVAKLTLKNTYKQYLNTLIKEEDIDFLLLQEVKKELNKELDIYDFSYVLSPNIETKKHLFGVLSAFKVSCIDTHSLLTKKQELMFTTRKVTLITRHKISNDKELLIVNLHAINFVKNNDFIEELDKIRSVIKFHKDPMIIAGDFNTWNVSRVNTLKKFIHDLSLKKVEFTDDSNIKQVFSNSLDYIFYRDLKLKSSKAIDSKRISDHNPIIATFEL